MRSAGDGVGSAGETLAALLALLALAIFLLVRRVGAVELAA